MRAGISFNLLAAACNQGSTLLVNLVIANMLGREVFGRYTLVLATLATVAAVAQLSMGYTATKHLSEYRSVDQGRASRILGLCTVVSVAAALVAGLALAMSADWLARELLDAADLSSLLRIASLAVFATVLIGFFSGALAGLEHYSGLAKTAVVSGTIYTVLCVVLARRFGLTGAVIGIAVSALVQSAILGTLLVREASRQGFAITYSGLWQERAILSTFALPASLSGLVALPASWFASALLARHEGGFHQLALFGAANSFRTMVLFLPQAINNVGMSLLNNEARSGADGYRRVFWMNASLTAVSALATAAVLFLAGTPLLRIFGPAFTDGQRVLGILLGAGVVEAIAVAAYQIVVSRRHIWASLFCVSLPRDVSIVLLALLLTPTFGAAGLATAHLVGWILALAGILALVRRGGIGASAALPLSVP